MDAAGAVISHLRNAEAGPGHDGRGDRPPAWITRPQRGSSICWGRPPEHDKRFGSPRCATRGSDHAPCAARHEIRCRPGKERRGSAKKVAASLCRPRSSWFWDWLPSAQYLATRGTQVAVCGASEASRSTKPAAASRRAFLAVIGEGPAYGGIDEATAAPGPLDRREKFDPLLGSWNMTARSETRRAAMEARRKYSRPVAGRSTRLEGGVHEMAKRHAMRSMVPWVWSMKIRP